MPIPFLIISDAPTSGTGLGRITRDIATRMHAHLPEFRVGTAGYGGPFSRALGFPQYQIDMHEWVIFNLPEIWRDFAGEEKGIVLTIWDASRLLWFSRPETCKDPLLKNFLYRAPFERWGYFPVDATGPNDKLTDIIRHTITTYDRVLAYSRWAEDILRRTLGPKDVAQLPHGIDCSIFNPRNRVQARHGFGQKMGARIARGKKEGQYFSIPDDALFIGVVATNQIRKDWGLAIQTVAELSKDRNTWLWAHTDELERHWSLPALVNDYALADKVIYSNVDYTDDQMAWAYSACDLTLAIGLGEGYGYSAAESLACGTPVVAPDYGGGEFIPKEMLVEPCAWRLEGPYNCLRPVMEHRAFAAKARELKNIKWDFPRYIDWTALWPNWEKWLKEGIANGDGIVHSDTALARMV